MKPTFEETLRDLHDKLSHSPSRLAIEVHQLELAELDVRGIRESLAMSRQEFAFAFGLSLRTVQNWEEKRRIPEGPARAYLAAIAYAPGAVAGALRDYREGKVPFTTATQQGKQAAGA